MRRFCRAILSAAPHGLRAGIALLIPAAFGPLCGQSSWPNYPNNNTITITSGGYVGIGTTNPLTTLQVRTGTNQNFWVYKPYSFTSGIVLDAVNDADSANVPMELHASVFDFTGGYVGIGTTSPAHLLHVNGTIGAQEVIVSATGADYVFRPGYRLKPLAEIGEYIKQHQHLPGLPSAKEVQEKGISLGDMQAKLLAKVEELTLHMIQAEEQSQKLAAENRELRDRIGRLESRGALAGTQPGGGKAVEADKVH